MVGVRCVISLRSYLEITARFVSSCLLTLHSIAVLRDKALQDNHRPLYTCIIPSERPVRDRLFVPNKTNNIQVKFGGSGG